MRSSVPLMRLDTSAFAFVSTLPCTRIFWTNSIFTGCMTTTFTTRSAASFFPAPQPPASNAAAHRAADSCNPRIFSLQIIISRPGSGRFCPFREKRINFLCH